MNAHQQDWEDYVGLAKLNYNLATHSATKKSPFKVAYGVDPLQPTDLALEGHIQHESSTKMVRT